VIADINRRGETIVKGQADQSAALVAAASRLRDPTIVAGDFNSTEDSWLHVALRQRMVDAWEQAGHGSGSTVSFLGLLPLRVDYVYVGDGVLVRSTEVPSEACSDHRPVVSDLALGG
jgi:endonuclease/exonuclease/phosphatase (EEP) superfamily protein YafD